MTLGAAPLSRILASQSWMVSCRNTGALRHFGHCSRYRLLPHRCGNWVVTAALRRSFTCAGLNPSSWDSIHQAPRIGRSPSGCCLHTS